MRHVHEMLSERFPNTKIREDIEPELAVAKGAAILVSILKNRIKSLVNLDFLWLE